MFRFSQTYYCQLAGVHHDMSYDAYVNPKATGEKGHFRALSHALISTVTPASHSTMYL